MSAGNGNDGNGRIALLGDHKSARPTNAEIAHQMAESVAEIAEAKAIKVCEFYLTQLPELVARMLAEAFAAHGLELKPPPENPDVPTVGSVVREAVDDEMDS